MKPPKKPPTQLSMSFPDPEEPDLDEDTTPDFPDGLPPVPPGRLLAEEQAVVREGRWAPNGTHCGCCGQKAEVHDRPITEGIARACVILYKVGGTAPQYKEGVLRRYLGTRSRYEVIMKHYGVLVRCARPEGATEGRKDAYWRITEKGAAWIERRITLPRRILIYNNTFMGHPAGCDLVSIDDVLGTDFDLDAFLRHAPTRPAS